jgi:hypothetical protein
MKKTKTGIKGEENKTKGYKLCKRKEGGEGD